MTSELTPRQAKLPKVRLKEGLGLLQRRGMTMETWFLLYGGSSEDGSGIGKYVGRTTDAALALKHFREVKSSPYNTGGVKIITDKSETGAWRESDFQTPNV